MIKKYLSLVLSLTALLSLTAYSMESFDDSQRANTVDTSCVNDLGFDLYKEFAKDESNLTFSPLSISTAFGMLHLGARDETALEMNKTFSFASNDMTFHSAIGSFATSLNRGGSEDDHTTVSLANSVFMQDGFKILDSYISSLATAYKADASTLDFKNSPEESTRRINGVISEQTNEEIPELLKEPLLRTTRLVLANALYFKAKWASQFDEGMTQDGDFFTAKGTTLGDVKFMNQTKRLPMVEDQDKKFMLMHYQDSEFATLFVLPHENKMAIVEENMGREDFNSMMQEVKSADAYKMVSVRMPKFKQRTSPKIKEALEAMGLNTVFDSKLANLSGINGVTQGEGKLFVGLVAHEAVVEFGEAGTTAAAATVIAVMERTTAIPPATIENFNLNRPFYFYIVHEPTNTIMFMGRVDEPKN